MLISDWILGLTSASCPVAPYPKWFTLGQLLYHLAVLNWTGLCQSALAIGLKLRVRRWLTSQSAWCWQHESSYAHSYQQSSSRSFTMIVQSRTSVKSRRYDWLHVCHDTGHTLWSRIPSNTTSSQWLDTPHTLSPRLRAAHTCDNLSLANLPLGLPWSEFAGGLIMNCLASVSMRDRSATYQSVTEGVTVKIGPSMISHRPVMRL